MGMKKDPEDALVETLRELTEAALDFQSSDPDMPSHAETERRMDSAIERAKKALLMHGIDLGD